MRQFHKLILCSMLFLALPAWAKDRCFLQGHIESTTFSGTKRNSGVSDMIRLHMDANSAVKCEKLVSSYCRYNVLDRQYLPKSLTAYYLDDQKPNSRVDFTLNEKCKVSKSTDSAED